MAEQGTYSAYQRLTPISEDFSENLKHAENQAFRYREEKRRVEKDNQKKRQEFDKKYGINEEDYYLGDTEFRSVNDASLEAMNLYRDKHYDIYKKLQKDPNNINLQKEYGKIKNSVRLLKEVHGKMKMIGEDYLKKINDGRISGVHEDKWQSVLEAYDEGRIKVVDSKGNPAFLFYDKNGEFKESFEYKDLLQNSLYSKVDIPKEVESIVKLLGRKVEDKSGGGFVTTYDEWGEKQESTTDEYLNAFSENDELVADILNQMTNGESKQESGFSQKQRDLAKKYMRDLIWGSYDTKVSKRPFNRPQGRSLSFGDRQKQSANKTLYDISSRAYAKDREALSEIIGQNRRIDGKTITVGDVVLTKKGINILDRSGEIIDQIPNDLPQEEGALRVAMWMRAGDNADDVKNRWLDGKQRSGGEFDIKSEAEVKEKVDVPIIDSSNIDKISSLSESEAVKYLKTQYSKEETGFNFKQAKPFSFGNHIKVEAPNGISKSFNVKNTEAIKQFMEENSEKKTEFKGLEKPNMG